MRSKDTDETILSGGTMNNFIKRDFADDCIHLKACRRICKFHKINNRGCRADYCTAYETEEDFINKGIKNAYNSPVAAWMFDNG